MKNQASAGVSRSCVARAMQAGRNTTIATFQIFDLTGAIRLTILGKATKS